MQENAKEKALVLRKLGKSFSEISQEIGVAKSTLSYWFADSDMSIGVGIDLTKKGAEQASVRTQTFNEARKAKLTALYAQMRKQALREFEYFKNSPLFIAGVTLYLAQGDKTSKGSTRIASTNHEIIALFKAFLRFCHIHPLKIRAWLLISPDLDENECKKFWIEHGLREVRFNKSISLPKKTKTKKSSYGLCNLGIHSRIFKEKMLVWLELLPKEVLEKTNLDADMV